MDLLDDFVAATANLRSPPIFRLWAAIGMVSAVLSRHITTSVLAGEPLYGNTYIVLVGPPASGKSAAIAKVQGFLGETAKFWVGKEEWPTVMLSGNAVTHASANKALGAYFVVDPDATRRQTYAMVAGEWGSFFQDEPPVSWFQELADLWDCPPYWQKDTKTQGIDKINLPYVTILAGTQPAWFASGFPKNISAMGLPSRLMLIYSDVVVRPGDEGVVDEAARERVRRGLAGLQQVRGQVPLSGEAWREFQAWERAGMPPAVTSGALIGGYAHRRNMHAGKLALIVAMSRHPGHKVVELSDLKEAWRLLFEAEQDMGRALKLAGGNPFELQELTVVDEVRAQSSAEHPMAEEGVRLIIAHHFRSYDERPCAEVPGWDEALDPGEWGRAPSLFCGGRSMSSRAQDTKQPSLDLEEFRNARRWSAQHRVRWVAIGNEVWADHNVVGTLRTPQLAAMVAAVHNCFLPVANRLVMALRRLRDVETLE